MAIEKVIVARSEHHQADIQARQQAHCRGCSANSACGHYLLDSFRHPDGQHRAQSLTLRLPDNLAGKVHAGDTLALAMQESRLMQLALMLYGLPLLAMLAGTLLGGMLANTTGGGDSWSILGAVLGLLAGLVLIRRMALPVPAQLLAQPATSSEAARTA